MGKEELQSIIPDKTANISDPNLTKKAALVYLNDSLYSGFLVSHYEDGKLQSMAGYVKGKLEGESFQYYNNGQLRESRFYRKNRKTGHHIGFWPDGEQKFAYDFESGIHVGELKEWYASGQPYRFFNYIEGQENGSQKMWGLDGTIRANYVVKNDHRYGLIGLKNCKSVTDEEGLFTAIAY